MIISKFLRLCRKVVKTKVADFFITFLEKVILSRKLWKTNFHPLSNPYVNPLTRLVGSSSCFIFSKGPFNIFCHKSLDMNFLFRIAKTPGVLPALYFKFYNQTINYNWLFLKQQTFSNSKVFSTLFTFVKANM